MRIVEELRLFSANEHPLLGINQDTARKALGMQIIASLRRLDHTRITSRRDISLHRADPTSRMFDPERAAVLHLNAGRLDEAFWVIFLATHIGKHGKYGWQRLQDIYSELGQGGWTWAKVSTNPAAFRDWMRANHQQIGGAFGNHRKYESLKPDSAKGTVAVIESFISCTKGSPSKWFADLIRRTGNDPHSLFDAAYQEMEIARFGRLAKFDFLALLGRVGLVPMSPGSTYLRGATGPLRGGRLLVDGDAQSKTRAEVIEEILQELDRKLNVGMQVMEDSICNWQKSPTKFRHFKG
jgi:hypothetical protein